MNYSKLLLTGLCSSALLFSVGCTKEDSGDSSSSSSSGKPTTTTPSSFRTTCGSVYRGVYTNPISRKEASQGELTYVGPNLLSMKTKKGEKLVKIHGLGIPVESSKVQGSRTVMTALLAEGDAYLFMPEPDCSTVLENGQEGMVAHVFSASGKSFSETLLKKGYAQPELDVCRGEVVSSCYRALAEESAPTPVPTPYTPVYGGPGAPPGEFLWKPVSDTNGRLAIHTAPYGTTVRVNGETGRNQGGGNGFGSLARFSKPGCSYGRNVRVVVTDSTGAAVLYNDQPYLTIPDGCKRYRFKNGKLSSEVK